LQSITNLSENIFCIIHSRHKDVHRQDLQINDTFFLTVDCDCTLLNSASAGYIERPLSRIHDYGCVSLASIRREALASSNFT